MSKKHVPLMHQIFHDVQNMSQEELQDLYGIEIKEDKTVFDVAYQKTFADIHEWATFSVQQDSEEDDEDFMRHKGYRDDDEEY